MLRSLFELIIAILGFTSPISIECAHDSCSFFSRPEQECPDIYTGYDFAHQPDCPYITHPSVEPDGTIDIGT